MFDVARLERRLGHPHHHLHNSNSQPEYPPTPSSPDSAASEPLLQTRGFLHHTTPVKADSQAGATGTSVAQLPGRHFIVPPWLALVVWSAILFFIALTIAGFILSYQARKEFRMRVEEQRKAQCEAEQGALECKIPMTKKEFNTFTRKSIMILNTNSSRVRNRSNTFALDTSDGLRPRNVFDRPPRDSILVAEITPGGTFSEDDPISQFSRQMRREGLWDLAARKSKSISVASLSSMVPKVGRRHSNRFTMMDLAEEELDGESFYSGSLQKSSFRFPKSGALKHLATSQGSDDRMEDHLIPQSSRIPPVPKLPLKFADDKPPVGEKLSSLGTEGSTPNEAASSQTLNTKSSSPDDQAGHATPDAAFAQYASTRAVTPLSFANQDVCPDDALAKYASSRLSPPPSFLNHDGCPDDALAKYATSRAATPSPMVKHDASSDDMPAKYAPSRAANPSSMLTSALSADAAAKYTSTRAGTPSPNSQSEVSPDDAVAKSNSVLSFIRRSLSLTPVPDGHESPAPPAQMMSYIDSTTEPLPTARRSGDFQPPSLNPSAPLEGGDDYCKPFSVIIEEDDEDDFRPTRSTNSPFTPNKSSFWQTSQAHLLDDENIPLPRRLPQAALGQTTCHPSRLQSNTMNSVGPISTSITPSSSTSRVTSSSSHVRRSRSGSSATRDSGSSHHLSSNQLASPLTLTLKRNPSMSTNPYGRRKKGLDPYQHLPLSPRHLLDRTISDQHTLPIKRHPSNPTFRPPHSDQEIISSNEPAGMRRTASAQARLPLSGTMSSGGVRNSSFVP
ncbi:hypothetical protein VP01_49g11 [Puccinia sorghi]|uniref:Uncharacterized protein n=1 Tax=Puccinia sorghi TaxID=27349 RepID=A0A0L6ULS2_9BASI|nr:hypothetical protein VP01_49g11 [Puccinia sorghi]